MLAMYWVKFLKSKVSLSTSPMFRRTIYDAYIVPRHAYQQRKPVGGKPMAHSSLNDKKLPHPLHAPAALIPLACLQALEEDLATVEQQLQAQTLISDTLADDLCAAEAETERVAAMAQRAAAQALAKRTAAAADCHLRPGTADGHFSSAAISFLGAPASQRSSADSQRVASAWIGGAHAPCCDSAPDTESPADHDATRNACTHPAAAGGLHSSGNSSTNNAASRPECGLQFGVHRESEGGVASPRRRLVPRSLDGELASLQRDNRDSSNSPELSASLGAAAPCWCAPTQQRQQQKGARALDNANDMPLASTAHRSGNTGASVKTGASGSAGSCEEDVTAVTPSGTANDGDIGGAGTCVSQDSAVTPDDGHRGRRGTVEELQTQLLTAVGNHRLEAEDHEEVTQRLTREAVSLAAQLEHEQRCNATLRMQVRSLL